jgi:hypothetical protein
MAMSEQPFDEGFSCGFLGRQVRVDGLIETHQTLNGLVMVRSMAGCTGSRLCKKFSSPSAMQRQESVGCPFHDSLQR